MTQQMHYINRLACIDCRLLRNITLIPGTGVMLNGRRSFEVLPLVDLAQLEVSSNISNNTRLFTTKLTATLPAHIDVNNRRLAFLATAVSGARFLVGVNDHPYPSVSAVDQMPGAVSDPVCCRITVELTDTLGLLPVLD